MGRSSGSSVQHCSIIAPICTQCEPPHVISAQKPSHKVPLTHLSAASRWYPGPQPTIQHSTKNLLTGAYPRMRRAVSVDTQAGRRRSSRDTIHRRRKRKGGRKGGWIQGRMCDWKYMKGQLVRSGQSGNLLCPKALVWLLTTCHLFVSDLYDQGQRTPAFAVAVAPRIARAHPPTLALSQSEWLRYFPLCDTGIHRISIRGNHVLW